MLREILWKNNFEYIGKNVEIIIFLAWG